MMEAMNRELASPDGSAEREVIHLVVGAGDWVAAMHRRMRGRNRWSHRLRLFRVVPKSRAQYSHRFRPEDVLELPQFTRMLASALAEDETVEAGLRSDLGCLADSLDWLLKLRDPSEDSGWVVVNRDDLASLIDYVWYDESRSIRESLAEGKEGHIFQTIARLDSLLHGTSSRCEQYPCSVGVLPSKEGQV